MKRGSSPLLWVKGHWGKVSVSNGVTLDGEMSFSAHRSDISGTKGSWLLEQPLEETPGKVIVLWDNAKIHRCPKAQARSVERLTAEGKGEVPLRPASRNVRGAWWEPSKLSLSSPIR